jgi:hypothetical protein
MNDETEERLRGLCYKPSNMDEAEEIIYKALRDLAHSRRALFQTSISGVAINRDAVTSLYDKAMTALYDARGLIKGKKLDPKYDVLR